MTRKVALAATALGAVVAIGVVVMLVRGAAEPLARPFQVGGLLSPAAARFGDTVRGTVTVAIDPDRVEPASVRVEPEVAPFNLAGPVRRTSVDLGRAVEIRHVFSLLCLRAACLSREPSASRTFSLRAVVRYRLDGRDRTSKAALGDIVMRSRLSPRDVREPSWRLALSPLDLDARLTPALLAALLAACSLAAAATAARLLRPSGRIEVCVLSAPAPSGTGLERALRLLRDAVALGGSASQRRALDRLGRELAAAEGKKLESEARQLAWSREGPVGSRVARLDQAVDALVRRTP